MTAINTGAGAPALDTAPDRVDPFALTPSAPAPGRPRLLSYVGRWGRARRWLAPEALRVLDVGCSFAYGSAAVAAGGPAGRVVVGVECNPEHLHRARADFPWIPIVEGDAGALPVADGCADAVLLLDVIEHVGDPGPALAEAHRALRPGGVLIVSVPHRAPQYRIDALNVYQALARRRPGWPPLEPATGSAGGVHRHFTVAELRDALAPRFRVERVTRTGLGLEELVYLGGLIMRVPRRAQRVGPLTLLTHLAVYVVDDLVPWGPLGYNLTVRAVRQETPA